MSEPVRVIVQMRSTPSLAAASFGPLAAAPMSSLATVPGVHFDADYSPVPIPPAPTEDGAAFFALTAAAVAPTYVIRAIVQQERLDDFLQKASADPSVVGVFADTRIQPIAPVCPVGPVGTDQDVAEVLGAVTATAPAVAWNRLPAPVPACAPVVSVNDVAPSTAISAILS